MTTLNRNDQSIEKHPHWRGEDGAEVAIDRRTMETPPRAWGRLQPAFGQGVQVGNTPTGVGKTVDQPENRQCVQKHPHGRGEDGKLAFVGRMA